ncbi:hypothetical protein POM88_053035 [Heracleum sosnowskyi]|uniref:RRM domain-containing protein n=1 Tax=Heracleum sosnowskyi TaxID=360622 RepID=A0AAD8GQZ1_9APIA|nr:hypothetical protein POM88_053035 [Heracleum sosnowskyi]
MVLRRLMGRWSAYSRRIHTIRIVSIFQLLDSDLKPISQQKTERKKRNLKKEILLIYQNLFSPQTEIDSRINYVLPSYLNVRSALMDTYKLMMFNNCFEVVLVVVDDVPIFSVQPGQTCSDPSLQQKIDDICSQTQSWPAIPFSDITSRQSLNKKLALFDPQEGTRFPFTHLKIRRMYLFLSLSIYFSLEGLDKVKKLMNLGKYGRQRRMTTTVARTSVHDTSDAGTSADSTVPAAGTSVSVTRVAGTSAARTAPAAGTSVPAVASGSGAAAGILTNSIFVGGLPDGTSNVLLRSLFEPFGRIRHGGLRVEYRKNNTSFAFIDFLDANAADRAFNAPRPVIGGWVLKVEKRRRGRTSVLRLILLTQFTDISSPQNLTLSLEQFMGATDKYVVDFIKRRQDPVTATKFMFECSRFVETFFNVPVRVMVKSKAQLEFGFLFDDNKTSIPHPYKQAQGNPMHFLKVMGL